jgi:hypothetical protein
MEFHLVCERLDACFFDEGFELFWGEIADSQVEDFAFRELKQ